MARIFNAVRAENTPPRHAQGDFKQALRSGTNSRSIQIHEPALPVARQKIAGMLCVFQGFSTRPAAMLAAKLGAGAISARR
jgi:hypothetical protein